MTAIVYGEMLDDAEGEFYSRNQLMLALTAHLPVVLLERRPNRKRPSIPRVETLSHNLHVVRNASDLRMSRIPHLAGRFAGAIDRAWLQSNLRSIGISDYVYWLATTNHLLALGIPRDRLLYDCIDPNFLSETQIEFDFRERTLASQSALTLSTAHVLNERMLKYNPRSFLLPNATTRDFHPQETASLSKPSLLRGKNQPLIGYLGTIDWRFDASFVIEAAESLPDCTFAIVGRVNEDLSDDIAYLSTIRNVIMPGQVNYKEGREWVAAFDVGIIPFKIEEMNDAINPVKMYMYLMAGLPIVSTAIAECMQNPFVGIADSPKQFAPLIRDAVSNLPPPDVVRRLDFALENTWQHRADEVVAILRANGMVAPASMS
jgi:hypothetical protein